jgi:hypothetical protein
MSIQTDKTSGTISKLKLYLFPTIVTLLATMIWRDVTELRSDVKQLLAESSSNKTKVERLEKQVDQLNKSVYKIPVTKNQDNQPFDNDYSYNQIEAVLNKDEYTDSKHTSYIKK